MLLWGSEQLGGHMNGQKLYIHMNGVHWKAVDRPFAKTLGGQGSHLQNTRLAILFLKSAYMPKYL